MRTMTSVNAGVAGGVALVMAVVSLAGLAAQAPSLTQTQTPATVQAASSAVVPVLKVGDVAPDFSLPGSDGTTYHLADFKGVRPVVLAWFPRMPIKD